MSTVEEILGTVTESDILKSVSESEKLELMESQESGNLNLLSEEELQNLVFFDPLEERTKANEPKIKIENEKILPTNDETETGDDDETIATFLTATGEQLALYAVEDSDEIFAVALYDETGAPPTDFQFLMKSDVERLIGEGAVTTVKRPQLKQSNAVVKTTTNTQNCVNVRTNSQKLNSFSPVKAQVAPERKSQVLTTKVRVDSPQRRAPMFHTKPQQFMATSTPQRVSFPTEKKIMVMEKRFQTLDRKLVSPIKKTPLNQIVEIKKEPVTRPITIKKENISDELIDTGSAKKFIKNNNEIIEQSTVQYILCDDEDDTELTFDDIKHSLQAFKKSDQNSASKFDAWKQCVNDFSPLPPAKKVISKNTFQSSNHSQKITPRMLQSPTRETRMYVITPTATYQNPKRRSLNSAPAITKVQIKQEVEDCVFEDVHLQSSYDDSMMLEDLPVRTKVRSRKQQLTVVNRTDSDEIIIQPASAYSEPEEDEPVMQRGRKRGRKKKKLSRDPDYNPRFTPSKKTRQSVEVIDLDPDENDRVKSKAKKILEITLDDNKEKDSSDKENDIIMVGDSDAEDDTGEENNQKVSKKRKRQVAMECDHCLRVYKQRGALERHLETCPNLPEDLRPPKSERRYKVQKNYRKNSFNRSKPSGKEFPCKVCGEVFDMPLSVARHVRLNHTGRKKSRRSKNILSDEEESELSGAEENDQDNDNEENGKQGKDKEENPPPDTTKVDNKVKKGHDKAEKCEEKENNPEKEDKRKKKCLDKFEKHEEREESPEKEDKKKTRGSNKAEKQEESEDSPEKEDKKKKKNSDINEKQPERENSPEKEDKRKKKSLDKTEKHEEKEDSPEKEDKRKTRGSDKAENFEEKEKCPEKEEKRKTRGSGKAENFDEKEKSPKKEVKRKKTINRKESKDTEDEKKKTVDNKKDKNIDKESNLQTDEEPKDKKTEDGVKKEDLNDSQTKKVQSKEGKGKPDKEEKSNEQTVKTKKLNCDSCQKQFASQGALNNHRLKEHKDEKQEELAQQCPVCKKQIPASDYVEHSSSHNREKEEPASSKQVNKKRHKSQDDPKPRRSSRLHTAL